MPREFNRAVMTNDGADLLNRAQAGNAVLEFTRMAVGDGIFTDEETSVEAMQQMTDLKSEKYSYPICEKSVESPRCLKLTSVFWNAAPGEETAFVTDGFFINEIGLFCREKDKPDSEVLYSVTTVIGGQGDYMPPYNGKNRAEIIQDWYATITNDGVAYIQNSSNTFVTKEHFDALISQIIGDVDLEEKGSVQEQVNVLYNKVENCLHTVNADAVESAFRGDSDDGNNEVWKKLWSLVNMLVGDVDFDGKGNLQEQIDSIQNGLNAQMDNVSVIDDDGKSIITTYADGTRAVIVMDDTSMIETVYDAEGVKASRTGVYMNENRIEIRGLGLDEE